MIDAAVLDDAKRLVAKLRSRGDEYNALVVEQLIVASGTSPGGSLGAQPSDRLSLRQAARALNLPIRIVKNWVATGKVRTVVVDGQTLVDRSSLLAYLDGLRSTRRSSASPAADETTRRELLSLAYPGDLLQRLRDLLEVRQERSLSPAERAELDRLEEATQHLSAMRLHVWLRQREEGGARGGDQEEGFGRADPRAG
jgi:hypothetical protein